MRFSVWPASSRTWTEVRDTAVATDRSGWDGLWFADHFMPNADDVSGPVLEVWAVLAGIAQATRHLRLGSLVSSVTYRNPAVLAKTATTIDHISHGRLVLGIGAGWQVNEHEAYGLDLGSIATRSDRLEEAARVIRGLLHNDRTDVAGEFFTITDAPNEPKPVQSTLPILVAGKGERRTIPTAARWADEWNGWCTAEEMVAKRAVLARCCEAIGRDPAEIACSTQAFVTFDTGAEGRAAFEAATVGRPRISGSVDEILEQVAAFAAAGADELIIPEWLWDDPTERADQLDRFLTQVIVPFRT
jgi:F420-dependent oxidoreductase-like protein